MKGAWRAADIRAAEKTLMARLPDGTLMRRAAGALAGRCARLLDDRFGAQTIAELFAYGGVFGAIHRRARRSRLARQLGGGS